LILSFLTSRYIHKPVVMGLETVYTYTYTYKSLVSNACPVVHCFLDLRLNLTMERLHHTQCVTANSHMYRNPVMTLDQPRLCACVVPC